MTKVSWVLVAPVCCAGRLPLALMAVVASPLITALLTLTVVRSLNEVRSTAPRRPISSYSKPER